MIDSKLLKSVALMVVLIVVGSLLLLDAPEPQLIESSQRSPEPTLPDQEVSVVSVDPSPTRIEIDPTEPAPRPNPKPEPSPEADVDHEVDPLEELEVTEVVVVVRETVEEVLQTETETETETETAEKDEEREQAKEQAKRTQETEPAPRQVDQVTEGEELAKGSREGSTEPQPDEPGSAFFTHTTERFDWKRDGRKVLKDPARHARPYRPKSPKDLEGTTWIGVYDQQDHPLSPYPMIMTIHRVQGNRFQATLRWPNLDDSLTRVEGTVNADSTRFTFTEKELLRGRNIVIPFGYQGRRKGDVIYGDGHWVHANGRWVREGPYILFLKRDM